MVWLKVQPRITKDVPHPNKGPIYAIILIIPIHYNPYKFNSQLKIFYLKNFFTMNKLYFPTWNSAKLNPEIQSKHLIKIKRLNQFK